MGNNVIYINCTAVTTHIGCMAVTDHHLKEIVSRGYSVKDMIFSNFPWSSLWTGNREEDVKRCLNSPLGSRLAASDLVIVNGEGTLHHRQGMGMLVAMAAAQKLGRPVHLVNTSIYSVEGFDDLLCSLDGLTVRESITSRNLSERNIPHKMALDSIVGAEFFNGESSKYADTTIVTDWHAGLKQAGIAACAYYESLDPKQRAFYPLSHPAHIHTWKQAVAELRSTRMILTGRYHGVYLAGLAGTPFVALPSNTLKIDGLKVASGLDLPVCHDFRSLEKMIKDAGKNPNLFLDFKEFLISQNPLKTFDSLPQIEKTDNYEQMTKRIELIEEKIANARTKYMYDMHYSAQKMAAEATPGDEIRSLARRACLRIRGKIGF